MEDNSLYIETGSSNLICKIHPVVLFSILDHHIRRPEGERVIGTLMGTSTDGVIQIRDCFPVPHSDIQENQENSLVGVDYEFHHSMLDLHKKVLPKEVIVGWYSSNSEISDTSVLITEFYSKENTLLSHSPIHLTIDTNLTNYSMNIRTYITSQVSIGDTSLGIQFSPIPFQIESFDAEKNAVNMLYKVRDSQNALGMYSDLNNLETSIEKLDEILEIVSDYVQKVLDGKIEGDPQIGRYIADALASLPRLDPQSLEKMFNAHLRDLLMVIYLANLTRTQLTLAEKLQSKVAV